MNIKESIKQFLPKYLSETDQKNLLQELDSFPDNIDARFFTTTLKDEAIIFQGDGISGLQISNFPDSNIFTAKCIITANTCDIDSSNKRLFDSRLTYCPLLSLEKYVANLQNKGIAKIKINDHVSAIKSQKITQILYIPSNGKLPETIVFLDRINNCKVSVIDKENISENRLFTLSNYGFYMLLLKLSISFTRIGESVNRS